MTDAERVVETLRAGGIVLLPTDTVYGLAVHPGHGAGALARLFAIAYRSLIDDLHERLADRGWRNVRPNYGFVLLAARGSGIQASEIAALMGLRRTTFYGRYSVGELYEAYRIAARTEPGPPDPDGFDPVQRANRASKNSNFKKLQRDYSG